MSVYLRAYGGTGSLITRALMFMMMINPTNAIDLYISNLDLDDTSNDDGYVTDYQCIADLGRNYNNLQRLELRNFARSNLYTNYGKKLKDIRDKAYKLNADANEFSVRSIFFDTDRKIEEIFLSCLEPGQINASNKNGAYSDLPRNALIDYPIRKHGYTDNGKDNGAIPSMNNPGDIVVYCGSTDGGTANSFMDGELFEFCGSQLYAAGKEREAKVFSIRTLPYKRHDPENGEVAKLIAENMVAQSAGVVDNITSNKGEYINYYYKPGVDHYSLDGLVLVGNEAESFNDLDDTNKDTTRPDIDGQAHYSHATELAAAAAICDILNKDINFTLNVNRYAGYNVKSENVGDSVPENIYIYNFFKSENVINRIYRAVRLYALIKLQFTYDFDIDTIIAKYDSYTDDVEDRYPPVYVQRICGIQGHGRPKKMVGPVSIYGAKQDWMPTNNDQQIKSDHVRNTITAIRATLDAFVKEFEPFIRFIYDVQIHSTYGGEAVLNFFSWKGLENLLNINGNVSFDQMVYDKIHLCRNLVENETKSNNPSWFKIRQMLNETYGGDLLNKISPRNVGYSDKGRELIDWLFENLPI